MDRLKGFAQFELVLPNFISMEEQNILKTSVRKITLPDKCLDTVAFETPETKSQFPIRASYLPNFIKFHSVEYSGNEVYRIVDNWMEYTINKLQENPSLLHSISEHSTKFESVSDLNLDSFYGYLFHWIVNSETYTIQRSYMATKIYPVYLSNPDNSVHTEGFINLEFRCGFGSIYTNEWVTEHCKELNK